MSTSAQPSVGDVVNYQVVKPNDWPEDFKHENGNYCNICAVCKTIFSGYKRRIVCKVCSRKEPSLNSQSV